MTTIKMKLLIVYQIYYYKKIKKSVKPSLSNSLNHSKEKTK